MPYVVRRLLGALVVLLVVTFLTFLMFHLLPTDVSQASCGKPCTAERKEEVRHLLGYDKSTLAQLVDFLRGLAVGRTFGSGASEVHCSAPCFGYSFRLNDTVTGQIIDRFPVTLSIALGAAVLWSVIGVTSGVLAALKRGTWLDRSVMATTTLGVSAPTYLIGLVAIYLLGFKANVLPVGTYVPLTESPVQWAWHLVLPWIVLAVASAAVYTRLTRSQLLEVMGDPFIRTARAKGLRERRVVTRHGLRNALLPIVTVFGLDLGTLLGGAVITEKIFSMPGLGSLLIEAVGNLDLPVILGVTLFSACLVVLANLVVDLTYSRLDPRVRQTS
ncbi:ABC transporter permease [Luteipulveratus mongoliensis]|uniref:Peptide ABC transporter permease n=1 Tax=Luteipulveratus mongoliensis TaxID=571913 RepID=A0A0K1JG12_9MICO|nr:ABC transporter permease [Luteipulveratus mongoliensis]AKU15657.1 peptide ABC transporter permease [Luteipulveratus mongoliensis]